MALSRRALFAVLAASGLAGCGVSGGEGSLEVVVEPESVIIDGLDPGPGAGEIGDGWRVRFDRYVVAVGAADLHLATDHAVTAGAPDVYAVDLTEIPGSGASLWSIDSLAAGRWEFFYAVHGADGGTVRDPSVDEGDFSEMQAEGWSYLVSGTLQNPDGVACPPSAHADPPPDAEVLFPNFVGDSCYAHTSVSFRLGAAVDTVYGPCEIDGNPGISVTEGATSTAAISIHGDHLFFNGFPEGGEGSVMRLAQWLVDCDLDLDGAVTREELTAVAPGDLLVFDERFQLGGSPITPINNMWDYLRAQLATQGHFQGEGECPIDGTAHDHG